jgi:hypothetical protein
MSKLFVDDIVEKTSGHGVSIPGHVVNVTRVQNTGIDTTLSTSTFTTFFTFDLTATAGNIVYVSSSVPTRGNGSGYQLAVLRILAGGTGVWGSGYNGDNNSGNQEEPLTDIPVAGSWVWTGSGSNAQTISVQGFSYNGNLRYFGDNNQVSASTTTPVFTFMEIAQ